MLYVEFKNYTDDVLGPHNYKHGWRPMRMTSYTDDAAEKNDFFRPNFEIMDAFFLDEKFFKYLKKKRFKKI